MNKEQQIEEMQRIICKDCAENTKNEMCELPNEKCDSRFYAELFYNAGYRKTFTSERQKAYKEGYQKGVEEVKAEYEKPIDKFIKDRETKAVKEFADKLKAKKVGTFGESPYEEDYTEYVLVKDIDELLKEYEK